MDLKEMIKVMQHFADGGAEVERRHYGFNNWVKCPAPVWNWEVSEYRIHKSPIAAGHNPDNLTEEQVECKLGWRLLASDEIKERGLPPINTIQCWISEHTEWNTTGHYKGNDKRFNYRTRLTPANLAEYDIKPKTKVPLTAQDFPPGTVVRLEDANTDSWFLVLYTGGLSISIQSRSTLLYTDLLAQWQYSTDGGKTWLPCYKEV